jgi:hypothetical protein
MVWAFDSFKTKAIQSIGITDQWDNKAHASNIHPASRIRQIAPPKLSIKSLSLQHLL